MMLVIHISPLFILILSIELFISSRHIKTVHLSSAQLQCIHRSICFNSFTSTDLQTINRLRFSPNYLWSAYIHHWRHPLCSLSVVHLFSASTPQQSCPRQEGSPAKMDDTCPLSHDVPARRSLSLTPGLHHSNETNRPRTHIRIYRHSTEFSPSSSSIINKSSR
jgi:hypothetical protein